MITRLGIVSGEIMMLLEKRELPMSIDDLADVLCEPRDIVLMSIGWLTRQGYLRVDGYQDGMLIFKKRPINIFELDENSSGDYDYGANEINS